MRGTLGVECRDELGREHLGHHRLASVRGMEPIAGRVVGVVAERTPQWRGVGDVHTVATGAQAVDEAAVLPRTAHHHHIARHPHEWLAGAACREARPLRHAEHHLGSRAREAVGTHCHVRSCRARWRAVCDVEDANADIHDVATSAAEPFAQLAHLMGQITAVASGSRDVEQPDGPLFLMRDLERDQHRKRLLGCTGT